MKRINFLCSLILLLIAVSQSLNAQDRITGNGQLTKQQRSVGRFDKLNVRVGMNVRITSGSAGTAELEGESNVLEYVLTDVKNGELTITFAPNKSFNNTKTVTVTIHVPNLDRIMVSTGSALESDLPIRADNLTATVETGSRMTGSITAKSLTLNVKEGSQARLQGTANDADIRLSGAGKLDADKLTISSADVRLDGASRADIHVTGTLSASADGVSTLTYSGNPTVKAQEATGMSKIRKQG